MPMSDNWQAWLRKFPLRANLISQFLIVRNLLRKWENGENGKVDTMDRMDTMDTMDRTDT